MRSMLCCLAAAVVLSAEAPPPLDIAAFNRAIETSRREQAAAIIDAMIVQQTPADGQAKSDPLLDALIGRLYLASGTPEAAALYLDHASVAALPELLKAPAAIDHGRALEAVGRRLAAQRAFAEAADVASSPEERWQATIGEARQILPADPSAARAKLLPIGNGPASSVRWEARSLIAMANSLLGDRAAAQQFADLAWADVPQASLQSLATLQVGALRAGLAADRGDVVNERSMLIATNGLKLQATAALSEQTPVCGDGGTQPNDYVTFTYASGPFLPHLLMPVAASRPTIVSTFSDPLGRALPIQHDGRSPVATVFTVRCRSVVSAGFNGEPAAIPLLAWFVDHGIYPASAWNDTADKGLNRIADRIDFLAAKFGRNSSLLIGPRWQMLLLLEKRAVAGDAVLPGQLRELASQFEAGMRQAGAPEWMASSAKGRIELEVLGADAARDPKKFQAGVDIYRAQLERMPFPFARAMITADVKRYKDGSWPSPFPQMVLDLDKRAPRDMPQRERQSWLLTLAQAYTNSGQPAEARKALLAAGFPVDVCELADPSPTLLEQHFSYEDYPDNLIAGEQEGALSIEFDIDAAGKIAKRRVLYSIPSGVFDEATLKGLPTIRYEPARHAGKAAACRAVTQPFVWRLEEDDPFASPRFEMVASPPTS